MVIYCGWETGQHKNPKKERKKGEKAGKGEGRKKKEESGPENQAGHHCPSSIQKGAEAIILSTLT